MIEIVGLLYYSESVVSFFNYIIVVILLSFTVFSLSYFSFTFVGYSISTVDALEPLDFYYYEGVFS